MAWPCGPLSAARPAASGANRSTRVRTSGPKREVSDRQKLHDEIYRNAGRPIRIELVPSPQSFSRPMILRCFVCFQCMGIYRRSVCDGHFSGDYVLPLGSARMTRYEQIILIESALLHNSRLEPRGTDSFASVGKDPGKRSAAETRCTIIIRSGWFLHQLKNMQYHSDRKGHMLLRRPSSNCPKEP